MEGVINLWTVIRVVKICFSRHYLAELNPVNFLAQVPGELLEDIQLGIQQGSEPLEEHHAVVDTVWLFWGK